MLRAWIVDLFLYVTECK